MPRQVLILGASTRAAAHSATRAGLNPICADLFADADLRACAQVLDVTNYPRGLPAVVGDAPACPWLYTGGLENHPGLIARIAATRPLWGNGPQEVRSVRDPWHVRKLLEDAGLPSLRVWSRDAPPPAPDGRWMAKPLCGAAGRAIRIWDRGHLLPEAHYFQERCAGRPVSAVFLAVPHDALLLGITRQLVGLQEAHAPAFAWCGTITPIQLPPPVVHTIRSVGQHLGRAAALRGLFGCDFVVDKAGAWLTEVNPRYPASTELVERVLQAPLLDWHRRACESFEGGASFAAPPSGGPSASPEGGTISSPILGKIILYADCRFTVPDFTRFIFRPSHRGTVDGISLKQSLPFMADIPSPGALIERGQPVCTLFARADTEANCFNKLIRRSKRIYSQLRESSHG